MNGISESLHIGSAVAGSDYAAVSSPLTFPATTSTDNVMRCLYVTIFDDSAVSETFTVTVTTSNPQVTLGNDNTIVTISDNEGQYDW